MNDALLQAAEAATLQYTTPRRISVAANFFHAYPRLFGASKQFDATAAYRIGIYRLGIPYLIIGALLVIIALIANCYYFVRRGVVPGADDTRESDPHKRDGIGRAFLLFSCFLNLAIILCIAVAFNGAFALRAAANSAHDVLHATSLDIKMSVAAPSQLLLGYAEEATQVNLGSVDEDVREHAEEVREVLLRNRVALENAVGNATFWLDRIAVIQDQVRFLSLRFFWFSVFVLTSCVAGLLLTYFCDTILPDKRIIRLALFLALLIPLGATWAYTAASTWVAVASGDFCQSVSEYHQVIASQAKKKPANMQKSNIFEQYQLQCPVKTNVYSSLSGVKNLLGTADEVGGYPGFSRGLNAITDADVTEQSWSEAQSWMIKGLVDYSNDCGTQLRLAGKISYHICADEGSSAVSAIGQLWLSSCGITLLFTAVVALLSFGHPPSEFCSARELMCLYGAPRLRSTFGDVEDVRGKQASHKNVKDGIPILSDSEPESADDESLSKVDSLGRKQSRSIGRRSREREPISADWLSYWEESSTDSSDAM